MSLVQFRPEAPPADLAHLVERNLAKVEVAGSIPVIRSKNMGTKNVPIIIRRHGQAVRQRSATPLSPVRFRVAPPKTKNQSVRTGFLFFASSPVGSALCAWRTESGSKDSRCRWHLEIPGVPFSALEGHGMALFVRIARFCFAIFGTVKYLVLALSCGTFLQKLSYNASFFYTILSGMYIAFI